MDGLRNTLNSATRDTLLSNDRDRKLEYRVILEAHADIVKDPNAVERGRRGGIKVQQNRWKLVEFKNMFGELFDVLFGSDDQNADE